MHKMNMQTGKLQQTAIKTVKLSNRFSVSLHPYFKNDLDSFVRFSLTSFACACTFNKTMVFGHYWSTSDGLVVSSSCDAIRSRPGTGYPGEKLQKKYFFFLFFFHLRDLIHANAKYIASKYHSSLQSNQTS